MRKVIDYTIIFLSLLTASCSHGLKPDAYVRYVQDQDNGLKRTVQVDGWQYTIQYKPYEYIFLLENRGQKDNALSKRIKDLQGTAWFNISFRRIDGSVSSLRYGVSSLDEYNYRLNYFLNEAKEHIHVIYGADTIKATDYLFENNYNLAPQETIVVGFRLPDSDKQPCRDMQLVYNDQVFKTGIIKTKYKQETLNSIPNLIY